MDELQSTNLSNGSADELLRQFLDNDFFIQQFAMESSSGDPTDSPINQLTSAIHSGPTIEDIESSSLSLNKANMKNQSGDTSQTRISTLEGDLISKGYDNNYRYTLRIKSCDNVMANDGYKWRKYGQKSIKNSPNPRSYYRCTNPRCSAKKQVERSRDDPDTLVITYEGLHLHFAYPFFLVNQQHYEIDSPQKKKQKKNSSEGQVCDIQQMNDSGSSDECPSRHTANSCPLPGITGLLEQELQDKGRNSQGLLEDIVPLVIRKPFIISSSSSHSSSPPTSTSTISWSPDISSPLAFGC